MVANLLLSRKKLSKDHSIDIEKEFMRMRLVIRYSSGSGKQFLEEN